MNIKSIRALNFTLAFILAMFCLPTIAKPYKSAEVYSKDENLYGKYVIRMRAAEGSGILSNFFLWKNFSELPSVFWEEVDIEVFGKNGAQSFQSNIITGLGERITSEQVHSTDALLADAYNTFSVEWKPGKISWTLNGQLVRTTQGNQVDDLLSASSYRFNFWPANIPAWVGPWDDAILPVHMFVNWIEYHQWNGSEFEFVWRDDFDTFDTNRWVKASHTFFENLADFVPENANVKDGYLVLSMTREGEEGYRGNPPRDETKDDEADDENNDDTSSPLACDYSVASDWFGGAVVNVFLENVSDTPLYSWELSMRFANGEVIQNSWNANITGAEEYTVNNLAWNATIAPGQRVEFGVVLHRPTNQPVSLDIVSSLCD